LAEHTNGELCESRATAAAVREPEKYGENAEAMDRTGDEPLPKQMR
jgi:hypothetical protein